MNRRAAIIGHPLGHSLSPVFQAAAFAAAGLDVTYERWETAPADLPARIESLRAPDVLGANVTIPHKEAVIPFLDTLDPDARIVGAVNTIVARDGRLTGHNTDGPGFVRALHEDAAFDVRGARILLLGAGGASRGIAFALARAGAGELVIANRTLSRAERLAAGVASATGVPVRAVPAVECVGFSAVVNATSIGMSGGPDPAGTPVALAGADRGTLVVDIVYSPEETPLLREARARGLPALGGLPMLIYQGALAFELWTAEPASVATMFDAARMELARRETMQP